MQIHLIEGLAGLGILFTLSSCGSMQDLSTTETDNTLPAVKGTSSLYRQAEIPMLQVDASAIYRQMLSYVTPVPESPSVPVTQTEELTAYIDFPAGGVTVNPRYGNNRAELEKLRERLGRLSGIPAGRVQSIGLKGFASPDGNTKENERLSGSRVVQFKDYLVKQFGLPDNGLIRISWEGEDWAGLGRLLSSSDKKYKGQVLSILSATSDGDMLRKRIKALDKGSVYKDIEKTFFSKLRRMELSVTCESEGMQPSSSGIDFALLSSQYNSSPDKLGLAELLSLASLYRPGTEQYREVYELAAYRFPSCPEAQLNAAAASLSMGDRESARFFFQSVESDPRSWNNLGVLSLMDGDVPGALSYFRKFIPQNPRLARQNMELAKQVTGDNSVDR